MLKITDKDLNSMSLEDLRSLTKRIKVAEKNQRLSANKAVAATLVAGDTIEFSIPKTNEIQTGVVAKVKRVMIAIKAPSGSEQWNVPLTSVVKKISSAPVKKSKVVEKVKANVAAKKATKTVSKTTTKAKVGSTGKTTAKAKPAPSTSSSTNIIKALKEKAAAKRAAASAKSSIETTIVAPTETPASE